ncbi:MAG: DEAD/DEAH box helicase [Cellulomonadaceae bacterium]|nr:DEAD/DEAH box helicase [Cellulomonadaceae bacterium]
MSTAAAPHTQHHRLLDVLLAGGARADRLTHVRTFPARAGQASNWPQWADDGIVAAYRALGVDQPWVHQRQAADAAWAGQHVALATSTGSGKSLAYWLPALSAVRSSAHRDVEGVDARGMGAGSAGGGAGAGTGAAAADAAAASLAVPVRATVLYLSPTKALAGDQLASLTRLIDAIPEYDDGQQLPQVSPIPRAATCDGDTPTEERKWVQDHADIVLTNPDFLHFSLLPNHRRWRRLLRGLRYVVIDEGHTYRGIFGAHVSHVLRRLTRVASNDLTFIVASATSADPGLSAARLIGAPTDSVLAVTQDASPSGSKTIAPWQPPEVEKWRPPAAPLFAQASPHPDGWDVDPWSLPDPFDTDHTDSEEAAVITAESVGEAPRRSATAEVADLLADCVAAGARTLAFTRSRRGAETVADAARDHLRYVLSDQGAPDLASRIAAYRGGYLPEERRALEEALRSGDLLGLATTNALELGMDIRGLDAVLIAGWPGTRMSLWQQAGRAGRAGTDGAVVFVAREEPLDTYLVTHPEAVFDAPLEQTVFDPANRFVLAPQLCAAAQEAPLRAADLPLFGDPIHVRGILDELSQEGVLRRRTSGWYWTHAQPAANLADLRGSGGLPVRVVESGTGRLLGTVDAGAADGQVHTGAVYIHQGVSFVVDHLDLTDHVALVSRRKVDHGTWSREVTSIAIVDEANASNMWGAVAWGCGRVEVTSQVISFERRRLPDMEVLGTQPLDLPQRSLETTAAWWTLPADMLDDAGLTSDVIPGALHAAEHASIGMLPLLATCDRWDLGGVSTDLHADTGQATVFVYDAYPGGAGFAQRGFDLGATWLRATRDAIASCPCEQGCPACIQSPKCGNYNSPLEKQAAITLLDTVLAQAPEVSTEQRR